GMYMRNQLLRDTDWASMAHSLEVRVPLVDSVLLKKLAGPLQAAQTQNRKQLLANSPLKKLPDAILHRAKTGFTTPIAKWQQDLDTNPSISNALLRQDNSPWARKWACKVLPI
ncbi:MAG: asparagine synthase-related protein, partial [Arenimonas sp.]